MTGSGSVDTEDPWILAERFSERLSGVLGDILSDVLVVGSATLDDWRMGSDVDLVCVVARDLDDYHCGAISPLHAGSKEEYRHTIDAIYLTRDCLAKGPGSAASAVESVAGVVDAESVGGQLNWVTWLNILQCGVRVDFATGERVRPVRPEDSGILVAEEEVREGAVRFSSVNLDSYWRGRAKLSEQLYLSTGAENPIPAFEIEWMSLGPARLLATVLTGRVVSKSAGGEAAACRFPRFQEHLERVLRARAQPESDSVWDRDDLRHSLDLARECVEVGTAN